MKDDILWMHGIDCTKCWRPAKYHSYRTGLTVHVSEFARPCRIHPPRPVSTPAGGD